MARPTKYNKKMLELAELYIKEYELSGHVVPSIVGLCEFLGVARSTLYLWSDQVEDFADVMEAVKEKQELVTLNQALPGNFNATIAKLLLAKHGYHDKLETENLNRNMELQPLTDDQVKYLDRSLESAH